VHHERTIRNLISNGMTGRTYDPGRGSVFSISARDSLELLTSARTYEPPSSVLDEKAKTRPQTTAPTQCLTCRSTVSTSLGRRGREPGSELAAAGVREGLKLGACRLDQAAYKNFDFARDLPAHALDVRPIHRQRWHFANPLNQLRCGISRSAALCGQRPGKPLPFSRRTDHHDGGLQNHRDALCIRDFPAGISACHDQNNALPLSACCKRDGPGLTAASPIRATMTSFLPHVRAAAYGGSRARVQIVATCLPNDPHLANVHLWLCILSRVLLFGDWFAIGIVSTSVPFFFLRR